MDPFWTPTLDDIKQYFSNEEWKMLTDYEKKNYINIMENYNIMKDLDMNPEEPDFVKAKRYKKVSADSSMDIVNNHQLINEAEVFPSSVPTKSSDVKTIGAFTVKKENVKMRKRKQNGKSTLSVPNEELKSLGSPSPKKRDIFIRSKERKTSSDEEAFTQEEILESVILDNTVGALYEYCLSDLFKESCTISKDTASMPSGIQPNSDKKNFENHNQVLKYLKSLNCTKEKLPEEHKHIYCKPCQRFYSFFCPQGHRIPILDLPSKPLGTGTQFPDCLAIGTSGISEAGLGIWSTGIIEKGVVWGPFKDTIIPEISDNERERRTIQDKLNYLLKDFAIIKRTWNTLINCARHEGERNIMWFNHKEQVYYKVLKRIPLATELLMFYTKEDFEKMGIDSVRFKNIKLEVSREEIVIACDKCCALYANSRFILRHKKTCPERPVTMTEHQRETDRQDLDLVRSPNYNISSVKQRSKLSLVETIEKAECTFVDKLETKTENIYCTLAPQNVAHISAGDTNEKIRIYSDMNSDGKRKIDKYNDYTKRFYKKEYLEVQETTHILKAFTHSSDLKKHKRIHSDDRPCKCDVSDKAFTESGSLITHKRIHSGDRPYKCDVCDKAFTDSGSLITHQRIHSGNRPYKCDVCDKVFTESGSLITHKRIHSGDRPYKCDVCDKAFTQSGSLITHKRIHSGDRPYKCDVCDKAFTDYSALIKHKRIHSGDRPYKCDVCDKAFSNSSNLGEHKRIHSGDRPFKCDVCKKAFTTSSNLNKHKRLHSGDRPYDL